MEILDNIDVSTFSQTDQNLIFDIQHTYSEVKLLEKQFPEKWVNLNRCYLVFAYNLLDLNLTDQGLKMLNNVNPNYYTDYLLDDMRTAEDHWQQSELYKDKQDDFSKQQFQFHKSESEFLIVAFGLVIKLQNLDFANKQQFIEFTKILLTQSFRLPNNNV